MLIVVVRFPHRRTVQILLLVDLNVSGFERNLGKEYQF